MYKIVV